MTMASSTTVMPRGQSPTLRANGPDARMRRQLSGGLQTPISAIRTARDGATPATTAPRLRIHWNRGGSGCSSTATGTASAMRVTIVCGPRTLATTSPTLRTTRRSTGICSAHDGGQLDDDADGFGNACDSDYDGNGVADSADRARGRGVRQGPQRRRLQQLRHDRLRCVRRRWRGRLVAPQTSPWIVLGRQVPGLSTRMHRRNVRRRRGRARNHNGDCSLVANPNQCDTDQDGYGNSCDADFDRRGRVEATISAVWSGPPRGRGQWRRHRHGLRWRREWRGLSHAASAVQATHRPARARRGCAAREPLRVRYPCTGETCDDDGDGIINRADDCAQSANARQCDTDRDGFGNACDGDFDESGAIDAVDFERYFEPDRRAGTDSGRGTDMNCDRVWTAPTSPTSSFPG